MKRVAIDFDDTYTTDPEAWDKVIGILQASGFEVWCVTARPDHHMDKVYDTVGQVVGRDRCIGTNLHGKIGYVQRHYGLVFDIWIDDNPRAVVKTIFRRYDPEYNK